jgi:hypothetical protein
MAHPGALPDASVPEEPFPLPGPLPADAILPAQRASDASDAVPPDEARGVALPALADERYAEKLAGPAQAVPEPDAKSRQATPLLAEAAEPCTPDADQSAA